VSGQRTLILGVESSCDETAAAVVADGREVLSNVVAGQIEVHRRFGGVVPELASRAHIEAVNTVLAEALDPAGVGRCDLAAVAVTHQPGLIGSLLVGLMAGKTLAFAWNLPLVGVNHIHAHAYAPALDDEPIDYPAVALVASGGHTALYRCTAPDELELLGSTVDDAAGEAYDKVASILELGFPGGPAIDQAAATGNPRAVDFPRTLLKGQSLDFSFSGLKTAVLYHVRGIPAGRKPGLRPKQPLESLTDQDRADLAASFQAAVVETLTVKLRRAIEQTGARTLILGGGVAANSALRASAGALAEKLGCVLRRPAMTYCTDNAAMIAGLGYHLLLAGKTDGLSLPATPTVRA
jgi:N6-L-threonylcarbamoyladenine synthase